MPKGESVFSNEKLDKLLGSLRRNLNKEKIKTKAKYKADEMELDFKRSFLDDRGEINCSLILKKPSSRNVINIECYGMHKEEHFETFNLIFDYAKQVAAVLKIKTIISDRYSSSNTAKFGFICAKEYPGESYCLALLGSTAESDRYFSDDKSPHEEVFYYELEEGYIRRKLELVDEFELATQFVQDRDVTFLNNGNYRNETFSGFEFYYEGFNGRIKFFYDDLRLTLESGEWHESKLIETRNLKAKEDLIKQVSLLVDSGVETLGLTRLTNPPRRHFKSYVSKNFFNLNSLSDKIFEALLGFYDAKEIEVKILSEKERTYHSYEGNYVFGVLAKYFVLEYKSKNITTFDTKEEAIDFFDRICSEMEKAIYMEKLSKMKVVKDKAITEII